MKILLIYPLLSRRRSNIDENKQYWPPLGLAYLASVLEARGDIVQILDRDVVLRKNAMDFEKTDKITLDRIEEMDADAAGISVTTPNMPDVFHVSKIIKERFPDVMVVAGGPHVTGEPALTLKEAPYVDAVVRGEGELTISEIAEGRDIALIKGVTYRRGSDFVSNADRDNISDIDELPLPARHLLDMKFYTRPSRFTSRNLSLRATSIFTARGCPYRCAYCAGPLVFSGKVRFHSPERVIREIDELVSKYQVEALYFAEDMFLSSRRRAEELLGLFIDKGIAEKVRWIAQAKANIITEDLLSLMKKSGCVGLEYGFESGSQRVLNLMHKKLSVEESLEAARLTRRSGLRFQANIIAGYPGEKEDDFRRTIEFIKKIRPSMVGFNIFMPLPGTASYEELKAGGKALPRWEDIGDPETPHINYADMPENVFERLYFETRLKVILPINLRNFVKDNIKNPLRLIKVGLTQFKGVVVKTLRASFRLMSLKRAGKGDVTVVLYISYNGLLEPIITSQAIPYLEALARRGFKFVLVTYEKRKDLKKARGAELRLMKKELKAKGIEWHYLVYHKYPPGISTLYDLLAGAVYALPLVIREKVAIVHVRGITPGIMVMLLSKILRFKTLFDMRGLLAEEYVGGGLWRENGLSFRLVKKAEERMLRTADAVTVLTRKHLEFNKGIDWLVSRKIPMEVVPCCVDMDRFRYSSEERAAARRELGYADEFLLMYPGKIGTFYFVKEMMDFYLKLSEAIPGAVFLVLTNDPPGPLLEMAKARALGEDRVRVITGLGFEDMPRHVRAADAGIFFINPYKKIGSSPIKMGEFLASGVPVIINPGVGDTEEMVRGNRAGVVVTDFSAPAYKGAVKELMALKDEGADLKTRCRDTASRHLSLAGGVEKYSGIYAALSLKAI